MKIFSLIICLLLINNKEVTIQEKVSWPVIKTIKRKANSISTDRLGNLYLIGANDILLYNTKGDSIAAFNSRKYGEISHVDTTDPYKILVFFKDYALILFLDNFLSEKGSPIDLQRLGFDQVVMACQSRVSGFWIYDQMSQKAYRLNDDLTIIHQSINLSQWFQKRIIPNEMIEFNNKLYLNEYESGVYVFDHFATYLNKIDLKEIKSIQVLENRINYVQANQFCEYDIKSFTSKCRPLDKGNIIDARVEKNRFYLLDSVNATIYKTN